MLSAVTKRSIQSILENMMESAFEKRLKNDPFNAQKEKLEKPFHFALAPSILWKAAKMERTLVTNMGQIGWERIAEVIAQHHHGTSERNKVIDGFICQGQLEQIQKILTKLERRDATPNTPEEIKRMLSRTDGKLIPIRVIVDLYIHNPDHDQHYYFEIKSPLPNSDQSKVSKEKMLKLIAMNLNSANHHAFFALPYNPFGTRDKYNHFGVKRWFNMQKDERVLIADSFWDLVGGKDTYDELLVLFQDVGKPYRERMLKEYFGLKDWF